MSRAGKCIGCGARTSSKSKGAFRCRNCQLGHRPVPMVEEEVEQLTEAQLEALDGARVELSPRGRELLLPGESPTAASCTWKPFARLA